MTDRVAIFAPSPQLTVVTALEAGVAVLSGVSLVVVSRAAESALVVHSGKEFTANASVLQPVDSSGGGDSMTAGIAAGLAQGEDLPSVLRLGAAAGAINVTRHGLGTGSGESVRALVECVTFDEVA